MFIVDTQVHIWKEETPDRPWIPGARERMRLNGHREKAFTYQECIALMDEAGVDRVLIVPPSWEGDRIDYALEACEAYPGRFGIMARVPQNKPSEGAALMRSFASNPHVKGTRLMRKSSTSAPFWSTAWARTPAGALVTSPGPSQGR